MRTTKLCLGLFLALGLGACGCGSDEGEDAGSSSGGAGGGAAGQAGTAGASGGVVGGAGGAAAGAAGSTLGSTSSLTQHGITWTFDEEVPYGQFANGDYWVVGPVSVVSIENEYHVHGFTPSQGQDGSMVNPPTDGQQGYDETLGSYHAEINAALPTGEPVSDSNPLVLAPHQSLVSSVSWLYESESNTEPDCPGFNATMGTPRPVLRVAAVLTSLSAPAPESSFRPPYCGDDKSVRFNTSQVRTDLLLELEPPSSAPDLVALADRFDRPWIDHVHEWPGAFLHPSENMPNYGRDMTILMGKAALALHLDIDQLPSPTPKDELLVYFVQLGIDFAGIADNGGSWPPNGGHQMGRKWPILFAGLMLDDEHMQNVGQWDTMFQEDAQTFYVEETSSGVYNDGNGGYLEADVGLPEWGIRHGTKPGQDDRDWSASYRAINGMSDPGFVLAALLMGQREAWNHEPLFDYVDRWSTVGRPDKPPSDPHYGLYTFGNDFVKDLWLEHRDGTGCRWTPTDPSDVYSNGSNDCP